MLFKNYLFSRTISQNVIFLFSEILGSPNALKTTKYLADVSDIFYFFSSGEGSRESEAPGRRGVRFLIENCRRGGGLRGEGGPRGREAVCREFGEGGAGLNFFLGGRKSHQEYDSQRVLS